MRRCACLCLPSALDGFCISQTLHSDAESSCQAKTRRCSLFGLQASANVLFKMWRRACLNAWTSDSLLHQVETTQVQQAPCQQLQMPSLTKQRQTSPLHRPAQKHASSSSAQRTAALLAACSTDALLLLAAGRCMPCRTAILSCLFGDASPTTTEAVLRGAVRRRMVLS